jgi:hypothetical protein
MNINNIKTKVVKEAQYIAKHYLKDDTKIATIDEIVAETYEENYVLVCVMHRMVHKDHQKQEDGGNPYKKQKKNYNRIYQFGDKTGQVCCIITEEQSIARALNNFLVDAPAIGQSFLLIEPTPGTGQTLRQDMPVLDVALPMLPLNDEFMENFPVVVPTPPSLANETTFFLLHNLKLRWVAVDMRGKGDVFLPSCTSFLCDRKEPLRTNHACGCFSHSAKGNLSPVVLEVTIICDEFTARKDRSYRTTRMFVRLPDSIGILQQAERLAHTTNIRKSVKKCYDFINSHGGFTVCESITRGEIQDSSETQAAKVASERVTYHVCYSQPTQLHILDTNEYKRLKFVYTPSDEHPAAALTS